MSLYYRLYKKWDYVQSNPIQSHKETLVGIPVVIIDALQVCYDSWVRAGFSEFIFIDNNADQLTKDFLKDKRTIVNKQNIYVNPAWNQILKYFLESEYKELIISNSDIFISTFAYDSMFEKGSYCMPNIVDEFIYTDTEKEIDGSIGGVCIALDRDMANIVYPIPESIKVWFGDNWILKKLKEANYKIKWKSGFQLKHQSSSTVTKLEGINKIIENDKLQWNNLENGIGNFQQRKTLKSGMSHLAK